MAIAYYIPDQAKLLAGRRQNREAANNQRNAASSQTPLTNQSSRPTDATPSSPSATSSDRGYGTTINVTVPTANTPAEATGCWDFLAQVFCHALRFYHESSQLQPTVIQISVNFQSQTAEATTDNNNSTEEATENSTSAESSAGATAAAENLTTPAAANTTTVTGNTNSNSTPVVKKPSHRRNTNQQDEKSPKTKTHGKRKN
ncbi:cell death protein Grim [Musca domestica]|uniref:Cell death protein Grim n=1 Tax=Musca domestica TaxID=7370 RepID=A0A9J7DDQ7_MUSDO|nr:cell death protein Grim [Musca domestica]